MDAKPADLSLVTTERLTGERITDAHLPDLLRFQRDEAVMRYMGGPRDEAGARAHVERQFAHWVDHGFGAWLWRDTTSRDVVGGGGLQHVEVEGVDEVRGLRALRQFWGFGLASEILRACVNVARDVLDIPAIVAIASPENVRSIRVLEKADFVHEWTIVGPEGEGVVYRRRCR